jgi:branched-chain amino acid transport system permease protein
MVLGQLVVNSLIIGSVYALVASGFSLIYATNRFMHFAHGTSVVVSAYILFWLFNMLGLSFYLSCILTLLISAVFGLGMYRLVYMPLQNKKASNVILLIASVGLLILFENLILLLFGADVKTIGYIEVARGIDVGGAIITPLQIVIIIVAAFLFVLLYLFMQKTRLGRNMRAVADNKELASIVGINQKRISDYSFVVGSILAGIAGILIALEQNLEPSMGTHLMIKGFTGAIIGGINFVPGSIVGAYLLGFAENFGIWHLPSGYKDAIAFVLLFIFLLFKPSGLFGIEKGIKK